MDGHLTKIRGGKKGQISRMIRFVCFFAAARVTTGHAVSVSIDILRRPFLATFRFANNPRTTHLMDTSAFGRSLKGEVKKKHNSDGWTFSCFAAQLFEQDLF
jgi:hypothetical protein